MSAFGKSLITGRSKSSISLRARTKITDDEVFEGAKPVLSNIDPLPHLVANGSNWQDIANMLPDELGGTYIFIPNQDVWTTYHPSFHPSTTLRSLATNSSDTNPRIPPAALKPMIPLYIATKPVVPSVWDVDHYLSNVALFSNYILHEDPIKTIHSIPLHELLSPTSVVDVRQFLVESYAFDDAIFFIDGTVLFLYASEEGLRKELESRRLPSGFAGYLVVPIVGRILQSCTEGDVQLGLALRHTHTQETYVTASSSSLKNSSSYTSNAWNAYGWTDYILDRGKPSSWPPVKVPVNTGETESCGVDRCYDEDLRSWDVFPSNVMHDIGLLGPTKGVPALRSPSGLSFEVKPHQLPVTTKLRVINAGRNRDSNSYSLRQKSQTAVGLRIGAGLHRSNGKLAESVIWRRPHNSGMDSALKVSSGQAITAGSKVIGFQSFEIVLSNMSIIDKTPDKTQSEAQREINVGFYGCFALLKEFASDFEIM